jgi:hypothetical protein
MEQAQQYETLTKYDRVYAGLLGGNNLLTKATTIEEVQNLTGETETFIIQTVRVQKGDYIVIKFMDKEGVKRLILPPRAANTIQRQHDSLTSRSRSVASKAAMRARMDRGELPGFMKDGHSGK